MAGVYLSNLKWILSKIKHLKFGLFFGFLLVILRLIAQVGETGIQKWIIDDVFIARNFDKIGPLLIFFGIVILSGSLFAIASVFVNYYKVGYTLRIILTELLFVNIYKIPGYIFQNERIVKYSDCLTRDVSLISEKAHRIFEGVLNILLAIVLMVIICIISPVLFVTIVICSFVYILLGRYFSKKFLEISIDLRDKKTDISIHVEEAISSTREVIAYNRMKWERKIYSLLFEKYFKKVMEEGKTLNKQLLLCGPLKWGINLIVLLYGGYSVISGSMTIGTLVVAYQFSSQLLGVLESVYYFTTELSTVMASIDRVRSIVEEEKINEGKISIKHEIEMLEFVDVNFRYSKESKIVLRNFSLKIPIRKKVAFVGTSGSGKSTITKLLIRYFDPSEGRISLNNTDLRDIKRKDWTNKVTLASQEPYFFPDTIMNNILLGRTTSSMDEVVKVCKLMQIHDYIISLYAGYDTIIGERGITLSGGQRQRIAIARAVLCHPEILILDEATSSLDVNTERLVQKSIDELRSGKSTIIIAHRLSTIQNADIIYVIDEGRLIEEGTHASLMNEETVYKSLVKAQVSTTSG